MAGHLPIPTTKKHLRLIKEFKTNETLRTAPLFDKVKVEGINGYFQRLPEAYDMFEETGKEDTYIFFYVGDESKDEYFEIHLDEKFKVNQIYLVM